MKDAEKTIQNTIEEGGEEEPPLEVSDSEMDFDSGGCPVHILNPRRVFIVTGKQIGRAHV